MSHEDKAVKMLRIRFPDGTEWGIAAAWIADNRAQYYATRENLDDNIDKWSDVFNDEYNIAMRDNDILLDWVNNNMDWKDIKHFARRLLSPTEQPDKYDRWFTNAEKEIEEV